MVRSRFVAGLVVAGLAIAPSSLALGEELQLPEEAPQEVTAAETQPVAEASNTDAEAAIDVPQTNAPEVAEPTGAAEEAAPRADERSEEAGELAAADAASDAKNEQVPAEVPEKPTDTEDGSSVELAAASQDGWDSTGRYYAGGTALTGWQTIGGVTYYLDPGTGVRATGERNLTAADGSGNHWYYFDKASGAMATGELYRNDDAAHTGWYYYQTDGGSRGSIAYGWRLLANGGGSKWVYYDPYSGLMWHGEGYVAKDDASTDDPIPGWCYFDDVTGATTYGWKYLPAGTKWVYYDPCTGRMHHGEWYVTGSGGDGWCYFDDVTGATTYGWKRLGDDRVVYYDAVTGRMHHGRTNVDGTWYNLDSVTGDVHGSCPLRQGLTWLSNHGTWVYYDLSSGEMWHGWHNLAGVNLYFDQSTGALASSSAINMRMSIDQYARILNTDYQNLKSKFERYPLQFANLQDVDNGAVTADMVNAYIAANCAYAESSFGSRSALRGTGQDFIDAANASGVNLEYLLAHAIIESGWGCSRLANGSTGYHNFFGISAYDSDALRYGSEFSAKQGWSTSRAAILGGAQWIANNYIHSNRATYSSQATLYEMRWDPLYTVATGSASWHQYATDTEWACGIARVMQSVYAAFGKNVSTGFAIPLFS